MHPHFRSFASRDEGAGTVAALEQGSVTILVRVLLIRLLVRQAAECVAYDQGIR